MTGLNEKLKLPAGKRPSDRELRKMIEEALDQAVREGWLRVAFIRPNGKKVYERIEEVFDRAVHEGWLRVAFIRPNGQKVFERTREH